MGHSFHDEPNAFFRCVLNCAAAAAAAWPLIFSSPDTHSHLLQALRGHFQGAYKGAKLGAKESLFSQTHNAAEAPHAVYLGRLVARHALLLQRSQLPVSAVEPSIAVQLRFPKALL